MNMTVAKADSIEVKTLPEEGEFVVRGRLRVILKLAIAIGRRECLLGKGYDAGSNTIRDDERGKTKGGMPYR